MKFRLMGLIATALLMAGCMPPKQGQNIYKSDEVGRSRTTEFGTVLNVREVDIVGKNSDKGMLLGGATGAGAGSYIGKGDGNVWATAGAAIAGAVAGNAIEQAIHDRKGWEYVVTMQSGETKTIVQEQHEEDKVFKPGQHVMIQYCDSSEHNKRCNDGGANVYQRVIGVAKLPPYAQRVKRKSVKPIEDNADAPE